jgi:hypothetical protein
VHIVELSSGKDAAAAARHGQQPAARIATGRRRRPSGEPPPLPRNVRRSGVGWLFALVALLAAAIAMFGGRWRGPAVTLTVADDTIVRWLSEVSIPGHMGVMRGVATVAWLPLITAGLWALVIALIALRRLRHLVVFLVAWLIGGLVFNWILFAVRRPRPFGVTIRGDWLGWALPSLAMTTLAALAVGVLYTLVPEGRWRNIGKWVAVGLLGLVTVGRMSLGIEAPTDVLVGVAIGVTIPLVAFRLFTPNEVFPVTYRRGRSAHLDVGGERGEAIRSALQEQLGLTVESLAPFGLAGSAGSTPLRIRIAGEPGALLFGKLYAASHLSADRWYKLGRELMYGRLEDEKPFHSVRRLVQQEDYMLRLLRDNGLPTAAPHGVAELTPEREYLLLTEFFDGAVEMGEVDVDDEIIDSGLAIVRRLWDAGLAHRDIKPSNLLVRGQRVLLIDVAFAELRPTPWRQAVDLANMMLCLALRSSPEQVYQRALGYFTLADIGEAFAAARGLALPSQLRRALRAEGRDLHAEFVALLPTPPRPVRIQRWSMRRVALWACVAFGVFLIIQNRSFFTLQEPESANLGISALECSELAPMWLQAQAVPSASLLPCTGTLPPGWSLARVNVHRGEARLTFDHDRAGDSALVARLRARCDVGEAVEVPAADPRVTRFQQGPGGTAADATWYEVFPGGCVTMRLDSDTEDPDVVREVATEAGTVLNFATRRALQEALEQRSDGRLSLDPAG